MTDRLTLKETDVLVLVDIQNDFVSGTLAIPGAADIIPVVNRLAARFPHVIVTQDWHPPGHISFASAHPGRKHRDTITTAYGPQTVFHDHCVQGTPGAELAPGLAVTAAELIIRKGWRRDMDSYSAFVENDRTTTTGLGGYLRARGIERVFCAGLALYGCVAATAEGAAREGFTTFIVEDASKGRVTTDGSNDRIAHALARAGVTLIRSAQLPG